MGWQTWKRENYGSRDPGRDAPDFTGTGDETGGEHEGLEGEEPVMTTLFEALDRKPGGTDPWRCDRTRFGYRDRSHRNPNRPDDRLSMKIAAEVNDDFAPGTPWIDAELARLREICAGATATSQSRQRTPCTLPSTGTERS